MIRLSYATPQEAHKGLRRNGWAQSADGTLSYSHRSAAGARAWVQGSTVVLLPGNAAHIQEVREKIEDSAARREEREFDAMKRA